MHRKSILITQNTLQGGTGGTKFHGKPIRLIIHCTTTTTTTNPDPITPTPATGQSTLDSKLQS
jgi:hypothetical protein